MRRFAAYYLPPLKVFSQTLFPYYPSLLLRSTFAFWLAPQSRPLQRLPIKGGGNQQRDGE